MTRHLSTTALKKTKRKASVIWQKKLIMQTGEEYKDTFLTEYKRLMTARLGLKKFRESDFEELFR